MSSRESILAATAAALSGLAGGRVYRERKEQLPAVPAIVITPAAEDAQEAVLGVMDAELQVRIEIYAKGDTPSAAADALLSSVHAALMADLSLGLGPEVQIQPRRAVHWDSENYDDVRVAVTYTIFYRTSFGGM
jgi:hypothetical protein